MDQFDLDFTNTPTDLLLPDQFYNWEITALEVREAASNKTLCGVCNQPRGKKMISVTFTVLEPVDYKGAMVTENFVVGIDTDPCAHSPATLAGRVFGSVFFGQLLDATQTPRNQIHSIKGKRCQRSTVIKEIDGRDGKMNVNNFARGVYPIGTVPVGQPTSSQQSNGGSRSAQRPAQQQSMVPCPRCKVEYPSMTTKDQVGIDDHVAECANKPLTKDDIIPL